MHCLTSLPFSPLLTLLFLPFLHGSYEKKTILKTQEERKGKRNISPYKTTPQLQQLWLMSSFQYTSFCTVFWQAPNINCCYHKNLHLPFYLVPSHFSTLIMYSKSFLALASCITETALGCYETLIPTPLKCNASLSFIFSSADVRTWYKVQWHYPTSQRERPGKKKWLTQQTCSVATWSLRRTATQRKGESRLQPD